MATEDRILVSTKKLLGLAHDYDAFDEDVMVFINSAFGVLNHAGWAGGLVTVTGEDQLWSEIEAPAEQVALAKQYVGLHVRYTFDPPATSFHTTSLKETMDELLYRLRTMQENGEPNE